LALGGIPREAHSPGPQEAGRDELVFLLVGHVRQICEALGIPADPRLAQVQTVGEKALGKKSEVEAATTLEEVEAISWENG
jgi:hypothetical protein